MRTTKTEDGWEMFEPLTVRTEVWPVAADEVGIWLLSGDDAWRSLPIRADTERHATVEAILDGEGVLDSAHLIHSTSWRMDNTSVMLTYMAIVECAALVRDEWPNARPVSMEVINTVGKPSPTPPTDTPLPRYIDVLVHGIRHLRFLLDTDAEARSAMNETWRGYLGAFEPTLTRMYEQ